MRPRRACWLAACLLLASACEDEGPNAPFAPVSAGPGTSSRPNRDAAAPPASDDASQADEDAGIDEAMIDDAVVPRECANVDPMTFIDEDVPPAQYGNAITAPGDFVVTRVETSWEASCVQPTIRITMSDGACPDGQGHELVFFLGVNEIESGVLLLGLNLLQEEPAVQGLRVRYRRPSRLEPRGEWGTCSGVSGTLNLFEPLEVDRGAMLRGRFDMELTACDGSDLPAWTVDGTFGVELRRGIEDVCPDR